VKQLAPSLAALVLIATLEAQTPAVAPTSAPAPWQPRPVIIIDPRPYLSSPSPRPAHRPAPHPKRRATPRPRATPETFERLDTAPAATPHPRPPRISAAELRHKYVF
jgi:hypothetical protein